MIYRDKSSSLLNMIDKYHVKGYLVFRTAKSSLFRCILPKGFGHVICVLERNGYNILIDTQYGFRKKYSPKVALSDIVADLTKNMDLGYVTLGIFVDLKKAFDTIDHDILLHKLHHYGVRGPSLKLFHSF